MLAYIWPLLLIVAANTLYNICAKTIPQNANPFATLTVTYLTAATLSAFLFFISSPSKNLIAAITKTNWAALAFGFSIVALEFGYIFLYRAGWKISLGSLVANISLACVLLVVGVLAYKESISLSQLGGVALCLVGLFLIGR